MDDLIAFLRARLDDDEQTARASIGHSAGHLNGADPLLLAIWKVTDRPATGTFVTTRDQWDRSTEIVPTYGGMHAAHIARHDPARVLAEADAKRRILDEHPPALGWDGRTPDGSVCRTCAQDATDGALQGEPYPCVTLRLLAMPYADHPDYQDEWRP